MSDMESLWNTGDDVQSGSKPTEEQTIIIPQKKHKPYCTKLDHTIIEPFR